jgi:tetratricopeptide (TPR) repeat protein
MPGPAANLRRGFFLKRVSPSQRILWLKSSEPHVRSPLAILLSIFSVFLLSAYVVFAQDQVSSITAALHANDYQRALELTRTNIEKSPADPQLWMLQGVAYSGMERRQDALTSFRNALKLSPDYLPALQQEAQLYYETNDLAGVSVLQHILRLRPGDPMSHGMIAVLEYKHGNCAAAVPNFSKSGNLLDTQVDGLHAYATCLVRMKRFDDAAAVFQKALVIQPESSRERSVLASIQLMAHKPQDAISTLEPLLTHEPDPEILQLAGNAYEDAGETDKAIELLRQAILKAPKSVDAYLEFAYITSQHESVQVGINVLNDGIEQQPQSAPLYFSRGVLYVQLANYDKAESDLQKAYELDPNESLTAAAQGLLAVQQNDLDRALADVQQKLKRKPNDPLLLYLQADVLAQKGAEPGSAEFQTALHSAREAVAFRPSLGPAHAVLAKLYVDSGQNQQAVEQCRKALEIDPKDQTSLYRLIQALRKTGETSEIPGLLKRLALLRQQGAKEQKQRYQYKVVEGDTQ